MIEADMLGNSWMSDEVFKIMDTTDYRWSRWNCIRDSVSFAKKIDCVFGGAPYRPPYLPNQTIKQFEAPPGDNNKYNLHHH